MSISKINFHKICEMKPIVLSRFNSIYWHPTVEATLLKYYDFSKRILVGEVYTDAIGPKGSAGDSYISMMKHNVNMFVKGLGERIDSLN